MTLDELQEAQADLDAIANAARRAMQRLPEGSTMYKAASAAMEVADGEARQLQPFIDALAEDAEKPIEEHLERNRQRAEAPNPLR